MLFRLDSRLEIENPHPELSHFVQPSFFSQILVSQILAYCTKDIDTSTARSREVHGHGFQYSEGTLQNRGDAASNYELYVVSARYPENLFKSGLDRHSGSGFGRRWS